SRKNAAPKVCQLTKSQHLSSRTNVRDLRPADGSHRLVVWLDHQNGIGGQTANWLSGSGIVDDRRRDCRTLDRSSGGTPAARTCGRAVIEPELTVGTYESDRSA